ncbi:hypothetical protein Tco_0004637 [Tanacetum coccineum]
MVEPEPVKKLSKKDQLMLDDELAFKLQAKEEEDRLLRQREKEANIVSWDNVQAMIDVDYQMAQKIQTKEQEKLSIKEKSKLFVQLLEARKKYFAAIRAKEKGNKPPTKAQKRNTMSTYLKNIARYKHNELKNKSFDDIQKLFDKAIKRVNTFVNMDTELVEGGEVRAEGSETRQKSSSKRAGNELEQENAKKQKVDEDKETSKLQNLIEVIPDEEEVAIDAVPLATKPPTIVDWKIYKEGKKSYYQIIRADGKSQMYIVFSQMLRSFTREDLEDLYKLVKARYGSSRPVEDLDLVLWNDLKTMNDLHAGREEISPDTCYNYRYAEQEASNFEEEYQVSGRIVGIKRLHDELRVTAAKNWRDLPRNTPLDRVEVLVMNGNPSRVNIKRSAVVTRTASAAAKPCQGDSFEFYMIIGFLMVAASSPCRNIKLKIKIHDHKHAKELQKNSQVYKVPRLKTSQEVKPYVE